MKYGFFGTFTKIRILSCHRGVLQGSLNGTHFGGNQTLLNFPYINALFGLVINDPCFVERCSRGVFQKKNRRRSKFSACFESAEITTAKLQQSPPFFWGRSRCFFRFIYDIYDAWKYWPAYICIYIYIYRSAVWHYFSEYRYDIGKCFFVIKESRVSWKMLYINLFLKWATKKALVGCLI